MEVQSHQWLAADRTRVLHEATGGGHDQKLHTGLIVPWGETVEDFIEYHAKEINRIIANYDRHLFQICELNGTTLNIDETFFDVFVWIMGKELIDRSALISQACKRVASMFVSTNETFGTPFDVAGAAGGTLLSAAGYSPDGISLSPLVAGLRSVAFVEQCHYDDMVGEPLGLSPVGLSIVSQPWFVKTLNLMNSVFSQCPGDPERFFMVGGGTDPLLSLTS